ncbi:OmpA family protein, partial [Parapedobacter deserti]
MKNMLIEKLHHYGVALLLTAFSTMSLPVPAVYGQEQVGLRERAEELYGRFEYANAAALYAKLADSRKPRLSDLERLAACYVRMNDYESAENWYARVVAHEGSDAGNLLRYGEVLKMNGRYAEAKKQLEAYASATGDRDRVSVEI